MLDNIKNKAQQLKKQTMVIYYSYQDPNLSFWKKAYIALVIGYLFSPIDLIPDFIPVIGYLDDLIIVPIGIYFAFKIIPPEVLASAREKASKTDINKSPVGYKTSIIILFIWISSIIIFSYFIYKIFNF